MDQHTELIDKAGELLQKEGATVAVAESVTSGNLQAIFSLAKNATFFFQGGMTVYNIGQKCRHLMVEPTHAIECNCVSQKVSEQMAAEICHLFTSDYGIGITGYASPVPEKNIKQLFAWLSIAKGNKILGSKKIISTQKKPLEVQLGFTQKAIEYFIEILKKN
jgi:PncC family amidohydrolase